MAHGHFQNLAAALQAQQHTAGVAKGGDGVDQLGAVLDDELLQLIDLHAFGINRGADDFSAVEPKALDGGQKGGAFHNHFIAFINQALAH